MASRTDGKRAWGQATSSQWSTTTADAPALAAAPANSWPSTWNPGTQKKSDPGRTSPDRYVTSLTVTPASPLTTPRGDASTSWARVLLWARLESVRSVVKKDGVGLRANEPPDESTGARKPGDSSTAPPLYPTGMACGGGASLAAGGGRRR